jgi:hypothetical protein
MQFWIHIYLISSIHYKYFLIFIGLFLLHNILLPKYGQEAKTILFLPILDTMIPNNQMKKDAYK